MGKRLEDMTLEELWHLFPIVLTAPSASWQVWYAEEAAVLRDLLPRSATISHVGSTAVGTIWAKPIVDILVEVPCAVALSSIKPVIEEMGYLCMSQCGDRISFNKGYAEHGFAERVFHLHLRHSGDNDELYFRDYLVANPDIAALYERLKLGLWKVYEHDRDGYTDAKTSFVKRYTREARIEYAGRY